MSDHNGALLDASAADALLAELGDALASEITDAHIDAARNAFWIARTDALIAELEEHLEVDERASVRGTTDAREHTFRYGDVSISLTVDGVDRNVDGVVQGGWRAVRWLDALGEARSLQLDDGGHFRVTLQRGPAAVEVSLADGTTVRTRWTLL